MRFLSAVALVVLVAACSSESAGRQGYYSGRRSLLRPQEEAMVTRGWMNPKTLQIHVAGELPDEGDLVLPGVLVGYHFSATGDIESAVPAPPVPGRCRQVFLMLRDRRLIAADAERPTGAYLPGLYDPETELFYPSTRSVVRPDEGADRG